VTKREKEILEIIRENPMISQKECSEILGITRSSVAGHIMNLTNKGFIRGKGYILKEDEYALVIGGANIDIQGFPSGDHLTMGDSNPGEVRISCGGVGRNIAENMARMGMDVKLLTVLGGDVYGRQLQEESSAAGVDMNHVLRLPDEPTSTYLSILNGSGDMAVAVSHMDITKKISIDYIREKARLIRNAALIVVDANLPAEIMEYITSEFSDCPIFADTVSTAKAVKLKNCIGAFHTVKPNRLEAEILTDVRILSEEDAGRAAEILLTRGVKRVFISLGEEGLYYRDSRGQELIRQPETEVINATGAGDAFMAGLAYSFMEEYGIRETARFCMGASALAIGHEKTINPNISVENIKSIIREMK